MGQRIRVVGVLIWTIAILIICGVIACVWAVFFSETFRIDDIEIRGNAFLTDAEIERMIEPFHLEGRLVWLTDFDDPVEALESNPRISGAAIKRHFPNGLVIVVREGVEFATLVFLGGGRSVRHHRRTRQTPADPPRAGGDTAKVPGHQLHVHVGDSCCTLLWRHLRWSRSRACDKISIYRTVGTQSVWGARHDAVVLHPDGHVSGRYGHAHHCCASVCPPGHQSGLQPDLVWGSLYDNLPDRLHDTSFWL